MAMKGIPLPLPRLGYTPASSAKIFFWQPGSTTKQSAYTDETLGTALSNPLSADSAGLFPAIYLDPNVGYKIAVYPSSETNDPPTGTATFSQDNLYLPAMVLPAVLSKSANYTVATSDGFDVLVLGDASGGAFTVSLYTAVGHTGKRITVKKTDSGTHAITVDPNSTQTIDGASTYTVSTQYDEVTLESNGSNWIVVSKIVADTTVQPPALPCEGRLTLTSGTPVTTGDVSAATSVYYTPYVGNRIALYDGADWNVRTFSEITISLTGLTASAPYDIFAYDDDGTVAIETLIWTDTTTRATALIRQDGVLVKSGATTRRYLGSVYINGTGGQTDDTAATRYLFNYYNRVPISMSVVESTNSWNYTTATYRQANNSAGNKLVVMVGVAEEPISVHATSAASNGTSGLEVDVAIGMDSTTAFASGSTTGQFFTSTVPGSATAFFETVPAVGLHYFAWLERSTASGTTTWYGDNGASVIQTGIGGRWVH